ncbi:hypothetical protein [Methyloceanibacter sp.]|uniref:hypothetical protein n=1 Tax=Methyloceanibacter sp. TaxID=1965321 RepID=UPI002D714C1E|nr:hypothetical protein [Methyloceanibacter sp.]HZP08033.1 hypothetical protein [Methyloceanibacter sp.]
MYKNSALLKAALAVTIIALATVPASAAGGGGEATPDQMPAVCKSQAASLKLSAAAADAFVQKCTAASASASRKATLKLEGTK